MILLRAKIIDKQFKGKMKLTVKILRNLMTDWYYKRGKENGSRTRDAKCGVTPVMAT